MYERLSTLTIRSITPCDLLLYYNHGINMKLMT